VDIMRKEYDFSKAKKAKDIQHLSKLQSDSNGKTRITIMLDNEVLEKFRDQASKQGLGYQTLINQTLRTYSISEPLNEDSMRNIIREEIEAYLPTKNS